MSKKSMLETEFFNLPNSTSKKGGEWRIYGFFRSCESFFCCRSDSVFTISSSLQSCCWLLFPGVAWTKRCWVSSTLGRPVPICLQNNWLPCTMDFELLLELLSEKMVVFTLPLHFSRLEDERYANPLHKEWFCLSDLVENSVNIRSSSCDRIFEPYAHFQLLLALTKLKHSWTEEQSSNGFVTELLFALGNLACWN